MGKCGARELNYVSDVDIIFVAEQADALSTRVASEMMRMASTACFEVDAGLRPEGRSGELVRTVESHVAYYKRWAKTWEFQALLKARAAVGDAELGERYLAALMPMVWIACERDDFVGEVQAMRRRVEQLVPSDVRARETQARQWRTAGCGVRRAAAAVGARPQRRVAACGVHGRCAGRVGPRRLRRPRGRREPDCLL